MSEFWENHKLTVFAVIALAIATFASVIVVPETQQVVIIRTGDPVRTYNRYLPNVPFGQTNTGLRFRIPMFERAQFIDKRVLDIDMERQEVLSSDQQRLQVDAYVRYRIINPIRMVQNAGSEENVALQLQPILASVLRQELGRRTFASMLTAERGAAMSNIRNTLDREAREYGAQVIDVRIKRADLPDGTPLDAAFRRMKSNSPARWCLAGVIVAWGLLACLPSSAATLEELDALSDVSADEAAGIAAAQAQAESGAYLQALATLERVLAVHPESAEARLIHAAYLCQIDDKRGGLVEIGKLKDKRYEDGVLDRARAMCGRAG